MSKRNWKRIQPTSLRQALELCKDHARERLNLSVELIADRMGVTDHWTLYKWIQKGSIPANMIRPYEIACGVDYITRWMAASAGRLLIDVPSGRDANAHDIQALQELLNHAVGQILKFHSEKVAADEALAAIQQGMEALAWHKVNVEKHQQPELNFNGN